MSCTVCRRSSPRRSRRIKSSNAFSLWHANTLFFPYFFFLRRPFTGFIEMLQLPEWSITPLTQPKENAPSIYLKGTHRKGSAEEFKWINFPLLMRIGVWMHGWESDFCVWKYLWVEKQLSSTRFPFVHQRCSHKPAFPCLESLFRPNYIDLY